MQRNNQACAQLLNLCLEPRSLSYGACVPWARDLQQEKPLQWEARALQVESSPAHHN